ncbi:MAG: hypothetical protein Kow0092_06660 [Deferrisomatales bacterium]
MGRSRPARAARGPRLCPALLGTAMLLTACAGGAASPRPAAPGVAQTFRERRAARVRARIRGEGADVVVAGTVQGLASADLASHVDIAVYSVDGQLLLSASAPYLVAGPGVASFEARLPGLRGRKIRLRLAHHGTPLSPGSGSCSDNAARKDPPPQPRGNSAPAGRSGRL